jgi:hypothetical protein
MTKDDISSLGANPTHAAASWNDIGSAGDYLKTVSYTPPVNTYALAFMNVNVYNSTANQRMAVAILQNSSPIIARQDFYSYNASQWVPVACIGRAQCNAGVAQQFSGRIYVWGGTATVYKSDPATQLIVWFFKAY